MAFLAGNLEAAIAAAAGDDRELRLELRASFARSLELQLDLMHRARCDGNWRVAARRLHSLGATFHDAELARLADEALDGAPGDPVVLRRLTGYAQRFANSN